MHSTSAPSQPEYAAHHIAVIGMSARFPGAPDIETFWQNLTEATDSIRRWTREELLQTGATAAEIDLPDFVCAAEPLDGADRFDAGFFGYSPAEAEILDPQQRIFLECAWHALENAGYAGSRNRGAIGIYASAGINTYLLNLYDNARIRGTVSGYELFVANDKDFLTTRAAYKLDLRGPAVTVQTACSSSLVAVHSAVQSLIAGECDMALAGGVSLSWSSGYRAREGGILSKDGHCRAFDSQSTGTVPGSGIGLVVLKRLDDAIVDGDTISAVILGSAINNDGALKASFTAPQVDSQAAVIADAQAAAGIDAGSIGYVETHGTGTALGDPIEIAALSQAFRQSTDSCGFCAVGSVKTNIGHLDTAAGIAGFIKAVLALKHRKIPPSLHFAKPNPQIDFDASPFFVNTALRDWVAGSTPRRAGVSSFGIGGTNAHLILEEPPSLSDAPATRDPQLLVLSARSATALQATKEALARHLEQGGAAEVSDIAFTLREGRQAFNHRQWVVASDTKTAARKLRGLSDYRQTVRGKTPEPILLFPGQGSQYLAMGKTLYAGLPEFRAHFDECATVLSRLLDQDFRAWLFGGNNDVHSTNLTQPALFTVEYALARMWMSFGLKPRALHGHSIGEYVAACLAGVFDLETALEIVVERGRLMQAAEPGQMLSVIHPGSDIGEWLDGDLALAAANAPGVSVIAGPVEAIQRLDARLRDQGVASRVLKTSHAFHSPMMAQAAKSFRAVLSRARLQPPKLAVISNLTGTWLTGEQATDPEYWAQHLLGTVRFEEGTRTLLTLPDPVFIEVGPGRTLSTLTAQTAGESVTTITSLGGAENADEVEQVLSAFGHYWQAGGDLLWPDRQGERRRVPLPAYPFERERYWVAPSRGRPGTETATHASLPSPETAGLYRTCWERAAPSAPLSAKLRGRFLIFGGGQIGDALAQEVERAGAETYRVTIGETFDELDYRCFTLPADRLAGYEALLDTLADRDIIQDHILFAWPLVATGNEQSPDHHARAFLNLVQALGSRKGKCAITVITQGAADITGTERLEISSAMLNGALLVAGQEYPQIAFRQIDADAALLSAHATLARRIRAELSGDDPLVALRGVNRWLPEVDSVTLPKDITATRLRRNGVYVVMGNIAEGVGDLWVEKLSIMSGTRIALLRDEQSPIISPRESAGRMELRLDCTDPAALGQALASVASAWGRIDGVFLSMAQSDGRAAAPVSELKDTQWSYNHTARVATLKALGHALDRQKTGFVCIQSSLSTVVGGLGLGSYAASYHAVDLLTTQEHRKGIAPWFAIGYPLIEDPASNSSKRRPNAFAITPDQAWDFTSRVIESGHGGQISISGSRLPRRSEVDRKAQEEDLPDTGRRRPDLTTAFEAPRNAIERTVTHIFQDILGITPIGVHDGFYELGGHSLLAIRAVAKLREAFPVDVEMRELLFENPTASAIAETISARLSGQTDLDALADLIDEINDLSENEVSSLLAGGNVR